MPGRRATEEPPVVTVVHFADPWCWWSWGLEPVLQRLKEVYGHRLEIEYRMGGTFERLDQWMKEYAVDERSAVDWIRESIGMHHMPLDPGYILRTESTYPACLAVTAAGLQDRGKAERYLRRLMEGFMVEGRTSTPAEFAQRAQQVGLDGGKVTRDMGSKKVTDAFAADRRAMKDRGMNFLSLAIEADGRTETKSEVFSARPFEEIIDRLAPGLPKRSPVDILEYMERHTGTLTPAHEIAEVFQISDADAAARLRNLQGAGLLESVRHADASFFTVKKVTLDRLPLDVVKMSHVPPEARVTAVTDLTPIVTAAVKNLYTEVATRPDAEYHFPLGLEALRFVGYPEADLRKLPPTATESFAGVGYPFATNSIRAGDTVLDIGSGSGTDILYSGLKTGSGGTVLGLDFTPAMIEKARRNIAKMGATNVKILEGSATRIPLPDASVDVVTSNGVLNLVPDKAAAFREIHRVLRPGGRLQLADIVVQQDVGAVCGLNPQLWADCIGGAAVEAEYLKTIQESGFDDVRIVKRLDYFSKSGSDSTRRITKTFGAESIVLAARKS